MRRARRAPPDVVAAAAATAPAAVSAALLARALDAAANPALITDRDGVVVWVNDAFCRATGYAREAVIGATPRLLKSGHQPPELYRELWATLRAGRVWEGDLIERRRDGSTWTAHQVITPFAETGNPGDPGYAPTHFVAIQVDVSESMREREAIRRLAYHDSLTGLPNRRALLERLHREIDALGSLHRGTLAVLYLDLDDFKPVNDALGHEVGDELLVAVGERLRGAVRNTDVVARLGGDEFAIVVRSASRADLALLAAKLLGRVAEPYAVQGHRLRTGASLGIARYPMDGKSAEALLRRADAAMYRAKGAGRGEYCFAEETDAAAR